MKTAPRGGFFLPIEFPQIPDISLVACAKFVPKLALRSHLDGQCGTEIGASRPANLMRCAVLPPDATQASSTRSG